VNKKTGFVVVALGFLASMSALGQQAKPPTPAPTPTIALVMEAQMKIIEGQLVPAAEAMPEDLYSFTPKNGEYKGVRTFAQEVKHVATANLVFYSAILGQAPPAGVTLAGTTNGPDDIQTKEEILKYLRESFTLGHRALATLTARNAVTPLTKPPIPAMNTRLALASFSCQHASDHYGQMLEYLRMNGIVPPASQGQPSANPVQTDSGATQGQSPEGVKERDGQHDFDFEFGSWKTHIRRLLHPLTGSDTWVELDGTSVVRRIWEGRANLGELEVGNPTTHLEGLSLRVYNPESRQWSIYWANGSDGRLGTPMVGQFKNGRGEFFDQELFHGAAIYVRFIFSDIAPTSFRLEQSFSGDGAITWEPNWIATFARQKD
jgi:uncharacterized damage-inducible protein DinB